MNTVGFVFIVYLRCRPEEKRYCTLIGRKWLVRVIGCKCRRVVSIFGCTEGRYTLCGYVIDVIIGCKFRRVVSIVGYRS